MKILELTRSFYPSIGGMEKFVADRLKIYDSLGYEYEVITTNHTEKKLVDSNNKKIVKYLKGYTPYEIIPNLSKELDIDYDILSVNQIGYFYSDLAIRKAFKNKKKIILTPHFYFHTKRFKLIKKFYSNVFLEKTLNLADIIICFTETEKKFWIDQYPILIKKIKIIPHYFLTPLQDLNYKARQKNKYLLYLGRYEKNKRIDLLIEAFNKLDIKFDLYLTVTEKELTPKLQAIVSLNSKIKLLGTITEESKNSLLANCSALVLPTDYEAFGIVNLEASFYKKPLIVSKLEVFKDVLHSDGVIFFENRIESISKVLNDFHSYDENKIKKMGETNYMNLEKYKFEKVKSSYGQLFEELFCS